MKGDRKKRANKIIKRHANIAVIIFFCIILLIVTKFALAKFKTTNSYTGGAIIALMANNVYVDINEKISGYPGCDPIICPITLTNKNENGICEITQKFEISIDKKNIQNLPIVFSMYNDELCTEIIAPDENGVYTNDEFILDAGVEQTKTVYLKISWPEDIKDNYLAFEIDYFKLYIVSTQV